MTVLQRYREGQERQQAPSSPVAENATDERGQEQVAAEARDPMRRAEKRTRIPEVLSNDTIGAASPPQAVVAPGSFSLDIDGDFDLGGFMFKDGVPFIHNDGGSDYNNTAIGLGVLVNLTPSYAYYTFSYSYGGNNTAVGEAAQRENITGSDNTATGYLALFSNTTGHGNTATGSQAMRTSSGRFNTAAGFRALIVNSGDGNTATGAWAMSHINFPDNQGSYNTATGAHALSAPNLAGHQNGDRNTATGAGALGYTTTGSDNTGIGAGAGGNWTTGDDNIALGRGADGVAEETGTIRIGGENLQTQTFIEGINGHNASAAVCIDADDRLGTCSDSSRRFKEAIERMTDMTAKVGDLRPVTFRFKPEVGRDIDVLHYGLIAEEVAEVFPTLVTYDEEGLPYTVRYDLLTPLLLNEVQRQDEELKALRGVRDEVADLQRRLDKLSKKKRFRSD